MRSAFFLAALLLAPTQEVMAYEIGPAAAGYDPIHQALTTNALACLGDAGAKPENCLRSLQACLQAASGSAQLAACYGRASPRDYLDGITAGDLLAAVKWPDDPTDQSLSAGAGKFGANMVGHCARLLGKTGGLSVSRDGLLCSFHYGEMQFAHSQASSRSEPAAVTRQKMFDWALFNYRVATGAIDVDAGYCDYFDSNPSSVSEALRPKDFPYCEERLYWGWMPRWLVKPFPKYRIATLYSLECQSPFNSDTCVDVTINMLPEQRRRRVQAMATGAILHMVQDSASQSHVERGQCVRDAAGLPTSRIDCSKPSLYTNYAHYNPSTRQVEAQVGHKYSDGWPQIAANCLAGDRPADDPITASAKVLWHIRHSSEEPAFLSDLAFLYGTESDVPDISSGPGACYGAQ